MPASCQVLEHAKPEFLHFSARVVSGAAPAPRSADRSPFLRGMSAYASALSAEVSAKYRPTNGRRMADEPAEDGQGTGQVSADEWPTNRPRMAKEPADEPAEAACVLWCHCIVKL